MESSNISHTPLFHLQQLREGVNAIEQKQCSEKLLERFIDSYDFLTHCDLSHHKIDSQDEGLEEINKKIESLCVQHVFGEKEKEAQLIAKIQELRNSQMSFIEDDFLEKLNPNDHISRLPGELLVKIFASLKANDMKNVVAVSKLFHFYGLDPSLINLEEASKKRLETALIKSKDPGVYLLFELFTIMVSPFRWKYTPPPVPYLWENDAHAKDLERVTCLDISPYPPPHKEILLFLSRNCPNLKQLKVRRSIGDRSLKYLPASLTSLDLSGCAHITDAGLEDLPKDLKILDLSECVGITCHGIKKLPDSLTSLSICRLRVFHGVREISFPQQLEHLNLSGTDIVDDQLISLPTSLTSLVLSNSYRRKAGAID